MGEFVGAIDQGTTSTRFAVIDRSGSLVAVASREHEQIYPQPGWVEHDAAEIWANTQAVVTEGLATAGIESSALAAVGITNQRETTVLWDRATGDPVTPAVVWQDTRNASLVRELGGEAGPSRFQHKSGLPLATYFSGPKVRWLLDNDPELAARAAAGELAFGTMDSWLVWNLTGRHATDVTNASRTMLMDLESLSWDDELIAGMGIPRSLLGDIVPSVATVGRCRGVLDGVPLAGILGDQQAAMFGQVAFGPGEAKNTYGTGCFLLVNTGTRLVRSENGLLTTVAYQVGLGKARYALEGSVAIAGAGVQWLRDNLGLIRDAADIEALALQADDNGDVYFVPAFSGLFAPYWRDDARGVFAGLTRYSNKAHIARAVLEATAFQTRDVLDAMRADAGIGLESLKVDGGMVANDLLMQFQADILGVPVIRPVVTETTVLGAAYAAGLAIGYWQNPDALRANWAEDTRFEPQMAETDRDRLYGSWQKAVSKSLDWLDHTRQP
jgi:glycerol kinase